MSVTANKDLWNQDSPYHAHRAPHSKSQVQSVLMPQLLRYVPKEKPLRVADFACGSGTIAAEFAKQAAAAGYKIEKFTLIDVVQDNLDVAAKNLKKVLAATKIATFLGDGSSFEGYKGPTSNFLYCWDAMVHFDIIDVVGYVSTLKHVANGTAFFHHSNLDTVTHDIRNNPHHRNFMTKNAFHQVCVSCGHRVLEQQLLNWGDSQDLDCFTTIEVSA